MAVKKKKATKKTRKAVAKKHNFHKAIEKKPEAAPVVPAPTSESIGGPTVIPLTQSEPELPKAEPSVSVSEPTPQPAIQPTPQAVATAEVSKPESTSNIIPSVEPIFTQDPLAVNGVVRDKPEQQLIDQPKKKKIWIFIVIIVIVAVLIGGVLWYFRENAIKQISTKVEVTSTPAPSRVSPTPASDSAKLIVDYSKFKIKVLNGSGIGGEAAKGKEILENDKFIVEEIGNAQSSDFDLTVIQAKKGVPSVFLDKLKSILGETYLVGSNEVLEESEELDVVVIIGSGKKPQN